MVKLGLLEFGIGQACYLIYQVPGGCFLLHSLPLPPCVQVEVTEMCSVLSAAFTWNLIRCHFRPAKMTSSNKGRQCCCQKSMYFLPTFTSEFKTWCYVAFQTAHLMTLRLPLKLYYWYNSKSYDQSLKTSKNLELAELV